MTIEKINDLIEAEYDSLKEFASDGLVTATEMMENMVEEIGEYINETTKNEIDDYIDGVKKLENCLDTPFRLMPLPEPTHQCLLRLHRNN
jgi:hypothetical protein